MIALMAADNEGFDRGSNLPGGSFSRLLLSDHEGDSSGNGFSSSFFSVNTPKMLCFGDFSPENEMGFTQISPRITQKPVNNDSGLSSPPRSSSKSKSKSTNSSSKPKKKRNGPGQQPVESSAGDGGGPPIGGDSNCKRNRGSGTGSATSKGRLAKGKRERLGERIITLQQLVSPFGKTDTASVLHEAMGYIRFLQDQVKVLCSPYLQCQLPSSEMDPYYDGGNEAGNRRKGLRSRGLCMVPVDCIAHIATCNGADFWSPSMISRTSEP
ncbi:hypothetical protein Ancab_017049 [Ancistrocladus abbreviatus]